MIDKSNSDNLFMAKYNPSVINILSLQDAQEHIKKIGCDLKSIDIMAPKAIFRVIKLENIVLQDAIIIKQDMLSLGGEVAIPRDAFELKEDSSDILIMGTLKQLHDLVGKLNRHYPRVKAISEELLLFLSDIY